MAMTKTRVYVAFDYSEDLDVKENLIAQARLPESPFEIVDHSITAPVPHGWVDTARSRIYAAECVIVLCGTQTHQSKGVVTELQIAQEIGRRYFLLAGTRKHTPTRPPNARASDRIWRFTWPTVAALLAGKTPPDDAAV